MWTKLTLAAIFLSALTQIPFPSYDAASYYEAMAYSEQGSVSNASQAQDRDGNVLPACSTDAERGSGRMCMITVESSSPEILAKLDTINIPTQIGKKFTYHGRPELWGRLLDYKTALELQDQLSKMGIPFKAGMVGRIKNRTGGGSRTPSQGTGLRTARF